MRSWCHPGLGASPAPLLAAVCQLKAREARGKFRPWRKKVTRSTAMAMLSGNSYEDLMERILFRMSDKVKIAPRWSDLQTISLATAIYRHL